MTATNGSDARALALWMPRATSSLPVPVSPSMSTAIGDAAALSIRRNTSVMGRADHLDEAIAARQVAAEGTDLRRSPSAEALSWAQRRAFSIATATLPASAVKSSRSALELSALRIE